MGKKSQARPGMDGLPKDLKKGPSVRERRKEERIRAGGGKRTRKKRATAMRKEGKVVILKRETATQASLKKLKEEWLSGATARAARREELQKKGMLYDPSQDKKESPKEGEEKSYPAPPFHWKVSGKKMVLFCEVILHKIPQQKITVDPGVDRLKLNTLGHSRKFVLDVPYPDDLKCDPDGLAELRPDGVLHIKLKITHMSKAVREREEKKQVSIAQQRALRFRTNRSGESVVVKGKPVQKPTPAPEAPAGEKPSKKKKKNFLTDKDQALKMIAEIGQEEKPKREERTTMEDHHVALKEQRKGRREEKKKKRQSMEDQAVKKLVAAKRKRAVADIPAPRQSKKDDTGKRVRFGGSS